MFLQVVTLAVLTVALGVKYITSSRITKLNQDLGDLELDCRRCAHRYSVLCDSKVSIDDQRRELEKEKIQAETELNEIRAALDDQGTRNRTLEDRIEALAN